MTKPSKKICWGICFFAFLVCLCVFSFFYLRPQVRLQDVANSLNPVALQQLKDKLQNKIYLEDIQKDIDIYSGNFVSNDVPKVKFPEHINILLLGGMKFLSLSDLAHYDFIFTSTLYLHNFLKANHVKNYLLPSFIEINDFKPSACALKPEDKNCFILVIGNQPEVIKVLNEIKTPYLHYMKLTSKYEKYLLFKIQNISSVIVNNSAPVDDSMDTSPLLLYAIAHRIPILSDNILSIYGNTNMENINITTLFADTLSYYTYESDIYDFLNCADCRLKKAEKAYFILKHLYTTDTASKNITFGLTAQKEFMPHLKNLVTIIAPTHAGLYNNGDYWLAKDLEDAFSKTSLDALTVFRMSYYPYWGDVSIYIRGVAYLEDSHVNKKHVSLMYLIFPDTDKDNAEDYALSMQKEFSYVDAVVVASAKVAGEAKKQGIKAYYLPQFTNVKKFYPEYDESKKSEVLFVGQNDYYRQAPRLVYDAGLPITIYGPKWKGLAQAEYVNNKILRQYYSSAKIVLNDTRPDMKKFGFISNRIYDVTASGGFLVSDYIPEIEEIYGDSIPMWKTKDELISLIKYYLDPAHEAERKEKAERAHEITLKNFTSDIVAEKFMTIIDDIKKEKGIAQ